MSMNEKNEIIWKQHQVSGEYGIKVKFDVSIIIALVIVLFEFCMYDHDSLLLGVMTHRSVIS